MLMLESSDYMYLICSVNIPVEPMKSSEESPDLRLHCINITAEAEDLLGRLYMHDCTMTLYAPNIKMYTRIN